MHWPYARTLAKLQCINPVLAKLSVTCLQARFMDAVVKVYCVHSEPNYSLPWQRKRQYASTSSGFIVSSGKHTPYLLTNAHSVEYHSQVRLLRFATFGFLQR